MNYSYVKEFQKLGLGMFVHFGIYSVLGKGEWAKRCLNIPEEEYDALAKEFNPQPDWADRLVETAKNTGCRYITLTTRHHDGFSLFDTKGLSDFDAPHFCGRDLVAEFVSACRKGGIVPFFYHTIIDFHQKSFTDDFPAYIDYLINSVALLCENYGKIGGLWFDGTWYNRNADWQEDRLYRTIRERQKDIMIINNTGMEACGHIGNPEIDSVTFERGKPAPVDNTDRPRAGEMCQVLNDHWGYCADDFNYKSVQELVDNFLDCRSGNCNYLLNSGPMGNGYINPIDAALLSEFGRWMKTEGSFLYEAKAADIAVAGADTFTDGTYYYAVIRHVPTATHPSARELASRDIKLPQNAENPLWLDSGESAESNEEGKLIIPPFVYGKSCLTRTVRFTLTK